MPEKTDPQSQNLPLREELKATTLAIIIKTWGDPGGEASEAV